MFVDCSFSKHLQNRRFCAEFGHKSVLNKEKRKIMSFVFFDLFVIFCSFLLFVPDLIMKMSFNRKQKKNIKDHAAGKITGCPFSFLLLDPTFL